MRVCGKGNNAGGERERERKETKGEERTMPRKRI